MWRLPQNLIYLICLCANPVKRHISSSLTEVSNLKSPLAFDKYDAAGRFYSTVHDWNGVILCVDARFPNGTIMALEAMYAQAVAHEYLGNKELYAQLLEKVLIGKSARASSNKDEVKTLTAKFGGEAKMNFTLSTKRASSLLSMKKAEEAREKVDNLPSYPLDGGIFGNCLLGRYYYFKGQTSEAMEIFQSLIPICKRSGLSSYRIREIELNNHVARLYIKSDEFDKAEEHLKTSLRLQEDLYEKTSYHQNCTEMWLVAF